VFGWLAYFMVVGGCLIADWFSGFLIARSEIEKLSRKSTTVAGVVLMSAG
jgi:hypothetical protein